MIFDELEKYRNDNNVENFCKLYILLGLSEILLPNVNVTVVTPIFKAPSVSLSYFIYMVRYLYLSGLLRWQLRHPYLKPQVSVYPTLSMWFVTYI